MLLEHSFHRLSLGAHSGIFSATAADPFTASLKIHSVNEQNRAAANGKKLKKFRDTIEMEWLFEFHYYFNKQKMCQSSADILSFLNWNFSFSIKSDFSTIFHQIFFNFSESKVVSKRFVLGSFVSSSVVARPTKKTAFVK